MFGNIAETASMEKQKCAGSQCRLSDKVVSKSRLSSVNIVQRVGGVHFETV